MSVLIQPREVLVVSIARTSGVGGGGTNVATLVRNEPANENDLSVLPGGVAPTAGFFFAPRAQGGFWLILEGQSVWTAYVPI